MTTSLIQPSKFFTDDEMRRLLQRSAPQGSVFDDDGTELLAWRTNYGTTFHTTYEDAQRYTRTEITGVP